MKLAQWFVWMLFSAAFCVSAAPLPDGWRTYMTGPADAKAQCRVSAAKGGVLVEDNSPSAEVGTCRNYPCTPGKYYRFTAFGTPVKPVNGMECTVYYHGKISKRAGQGPIRTDGSSVVCFGPVPQGAAGVTLFYYSSKNAVNAVVLNKVKLEEGSQPFAEELPEIVTPPVVTAREIFVAPNGDDAADGSAAHPWKTLEKASQAGPGTTVTFKPGKYAGNLIPRHSGAFQAPIVYRAAEPGKVILTGGVQSEYAAVIRGKNHIVFDGFKFEVPAGKRWLLVENAWYCTVKNCHMEYSTVTNPIRCCNVHYSKFDHLNVFRCEARGGDGQVHGDMWNNNFVTHCVYSNLYIGRAGHRPLGFYSECKMNVLRDSIFDCRWGRNFEFFSPKGFLMERCVVTNSYEGSGSADGRAKLFTIDGIFRYNLIYRNNTCPLVINAYRWASDPVFGMMRTRMYFNTWYRNQDCGWQMSDAASPDAPVKNHKVFGNVFKNNILADCNPADGTALKLSPNIAPDNLFLNNLLRGSRPGDKTVRRWRSRYTTEEADRSMPEQFARNFDADPGFTDAEKDDFRLKADSPAVDKGEALTTATEASSGFYLSVKDARYFYDGFGIPGEKGDLLYIGPGKKQARVVQTLAGDNMLVLDRRVEVKAGDAVNLAYAGKAPDPGCYESGMATGPKFDPAAVRVEKMDTASKPIIVCDFEETHPERWFIYWKHTRKVNSTAAQDRTTGATGSGSWKVFFQPNSHGKGRAGSVLSTYMTPANWVIDRFPVVKFSYRVPKGVPVAVSFHEDSMIGSSDDSAVVFAAGSPAYLAAKKAGRVHAEKFVTLTDDDAWHTVTLDCRVIREKFPQVKNLSMIRFWAPEVNGRPGDAYWIDDFAILPTLQ